MVTPWGWVMVGATRREKVKQCILVLTGLYITYLDLQNPKIFWSMWFVLLYCDDQLKSGRAHTIQTKSGRAWSHTALPVASG